jgi:hypothetical protein
MLPAQSSNSNDLSRAGQAAPKVLLCPKCETVYRFGELSCAACGAIFSQAGLTRHIDTTNDSPELASANRGELFRSAAVMLVIEGQQLKLPAEQDLVLGRQRDDSVDSQSYVDLSMFDADNKGVSRRHLQIGYQGSMIFVTDLGSRNGTWLNGERLNSSDVRLLRSGDELTLGRLRMTVKF